MFAAEVEKLGCEDGYLKVYTGEKQSCESYFLALVKSGKHKEFIDEIFTLIDYFFHSGYVEAAAKYLDLVESTELTDEVEVKFIFFRFKRKQFLNSGDYETALNYANKSLNIALNEGNSNWEARSLNDIGIIYKSMGEYKLATEYFLKSLEIKEKIGAKLPIATTVNNIGNLYRDLNDPQAALRFYQRTVQLYSSIENRDMASRIADVYENIGLVWGQLGRLDKGYEALNKSINTYQELELANDLVRALIIIAELKNMGHFYDQALDFLAEAEALEIQHKIKPYLRLRVTKADSLLNTRKYSQAITYASEALAMAEFYSDQLTQATALHLLFQIQEALGDQSSALSYLKKHAELKESINKKIIDEQLIRLQSETRFQESEKQLESLDKDYQIQQLKVTQQRLYMSLFVAIIIVLAVVFWLINKRKKIENLQLKNDIKKHKEKYKLLGLSHLQIEGVFSASTEPIICFDLAGYVIFVNTPFADLYQTSVSSFSGQKIDDSCPELIKYFQLVHAEDGTQEPYFFKREALNINSRQLVCDLSIYFLNLVDDYIIVSINRKDSEKEVEKLSFKLRHITQFQELSSSFKKVSQSVTNIGIEDSQHLIEQMGTVEQKISELLNDSDEPDDKLKVRKELVNLMCLSIDTWEISTLSDKASLAEKSKIWRVSIDNGSIRTRSMDRYLNIASLPKKPRWRYVVRTAHYILANCQLDEEQRSILTSQLDKFTKLMRFIS